MKRKQKRLKSRTCSVYFVKSAHVSIFPIPVQEQDTNGNNQLLKGYIRKDYPKVFTPEEIKKMSNEEFNQSESEIMQQLKDGLIQNNLPQTDFTGYINPVSGRNQIFTREDIEQMTTDEFSHNEKALNAQLNAVGIPANMELQNNSGVIFVHSYVRSDETQVRDYYRAR